MFFDALFQNRAFPSSFNTQYRCYSVLMLPGNEREDVDKGGKIILPPSALDVLTRLNIVYPMLFKLTNTKQKRSTHCGVLEFVADEGKAFIPHWMMQNLYLQEGDLINIESASLPVAIFAKFQPQTVDFLDISDPKAVLENVLRHFACLTKGDLLAIKYNNKIYEMLVLETKPSNAVSIIECDMQVDFAAPVGYVPPEVTPQRPEEVDEEPSLEGIPAEYLNTGQSQLFPGTGTRLDGKKKKKSQLKDTTDGPSPIKPAIIKRGIPDLNWKFGTIEFKRKILKPLENEVDDADFVAFGGRGDALRVRR